MTRIRGIIVAMIACCGIMTLFSLRAVPTRVKLWQSEALRLAASLAPTCRRERDPVEIDCGDEGVVSLSLTNNCDVPAAVELLCEASLRTGTRALLRCTTADATNIRLQPADKNFERIAILGDSQSGFVTFVALLSRISAHDPTLLVHLGDIVQNGGILQEWSMYMLWAFEQGFRTSVRRPLLLQVHGNHDQLNGNEDAIGDSPRSEVKLCSRRNLVHFRKHVCIIVLDSSDHSAEQQTWLETQLTASRCAGQPFRVVAIHEPPFIEFWDPDTWRAGESVWGQHAREALVPIFERTGVDLVVSGHSHIYHRGTRNGVAYVVSGGGGGGLETDRVENYKFYDVTKAVFHYIMLTVRENSMAIDAFDLGDEVFDTWTITRRMAGGG